MDRDDVTNIVEENVGNCSTKQEITMALFSKKPVVIEAFQWTGGITQTKDPEWIVAAIRAGDAEIIFPTLRIKTLEGVMAASPGDWIIKGIKGELYPCKDEIFKATYEPA